MVSLEGQWRLFQLGPVLGAALAAFARSRAILRFLRERNPQPVSNLIADGVAVRVIDFNAVSIRHGVSPPLLESHTNKSDRATSFTGGQDAQAGTLVRRGRELNLPRNKSKSESFKASRLGTITHIGCFG